MSNTMTMIETDPSLKMQGSISIKPYFDETVENMGLEKYGLSLFDGVLHEESLACLENNGIKRYVTGLNEFAPEIRTMMNKEEREAKIKAIRQAVAELEKELAANVVDPEDKEFWNKVILLRPDNSALWDKIYLRCGNKPVFLDPVKDPYDRIKLYAIEAGGFSMIARSYEHARQMPTPPKFYLDKLVETASTKTELKKVRNKALAKLQGMFEKHATKLMYVAKIVDANSAQYVKKTPLDIIYDNMDNFINARGVESNPIRAAKKFLDASELDMATLKLRAVLKDAGYYKIIGTKSDGHIYHLQSNTMMGKNPAEILEFLKNPLNEQLMTELVNSVENKW